MKKLPIGISTLENIRSDDYVYIDKTHHVANFVESGGKYFFLSRPRRFGKSLFIDTLKQAFLGNKALFKDLYLENNWDWEVQYPVIHLDFGSGSAHSYEQLIDKINYLLDREYAQYKIENNYQEVSARFSDLIDKLAEKHAKPVVILIDEYDKPLLDNMLTHQVATQIRDALKNLYAVIKAQDKNIKLAFLTGVSKFSKVSIFSGLNNLQDISLKATYADICGYTQTELEHAFSDYLKDGKINLRQLKHWYNGYHFDGKVTQKVYNPFDILLFFSNDYQYNNYWFETGTPSFLVKLLQENEYYLPEFENHLIMKSALSSFELFDINIYTLLFQTGYLTIKEKVMIGMQQGYVLSYPNLEVKSSFNNCLLQIGAKTKNSSLLTTSLHKSLQANAFDNFQTIFNSHFSSIPHDWYRKNPMGQFEGFYASIIYSCFCALGYDVTPEDVTSFGNIDLTVVMPDKILIIEFKLLKYGSAIDAIKQIKDKKYADKFKSDKRPIYLIGMSFDDKTKSMAGLLWEKG